MMGFMNPIFRPVDNDISVEIRNNIEVPKENFNIPENLPKEYEKIFSSITDSSQNLGDSLLQPFDNSKFMPMLVSQDQQNQQVGQLFLEKCQQHIVKFDRNRLQNILKILANQQQAQTKKKPKEQLIQKDSKQIISENRQQVQKKQSFNMHHFTKNDTSPKNVQTFFQKLHYSKSPKQRSSTNYTPRLDDQQNQIKPHSYKNLDVMIKNAHKDKFQNQFKRTSSEYFTKYVAKFQIDWINLKLKQLKTQLDYNFKVSNQLQFQNLIEKIIDQNFNLEKLRQDIIQLSECCLQINQKSQNFQQLEKFKILANEKYKTLQIQILGFEETSFIDIIDKKQANSKLSRQTTSDNILDEQNEEKKKFYALVVNLKLELPYNHPSKNLLLCELFNKAQKLGIKKSNWENFIKNEMKF